MQFVQTDIWINRNGSEYVIDLAKPYFFDVRTIFKYYGNTSEARKILKRIKNERLRRIRIIQYSPNEKIKFLVQNNKGISKEEIIKELEIYINRWLKNIKHHCLPMEDYICRIDYFIKNFGI
jgi:hypothetical protein